MSEMHIASRVRLPDPKPAIRDREIVTYEAQDGAKFSTDHPVTKAAMEILCYRSPQAIDFPGLVEQARRVVYGENLKDENQGQIEQDSLVLAANFLMAFSYSLNLIELHACNLRFEIDPGERPEATAYARYQAAAGSTVTNQRHERVNLDALSAFLLPWLDGKHDRAALTELLAADLDRLTPDLPPAMSKTGSIDEMLSQTLYFMGRAALLLA